MLFGVGLGRTDRRRSARRFAYDDVVVGDLATLAAVLPELAVARGIVGLVPPSRQESIVERAMIEQSTLRRNMSIEFAFEAS
jgi:hypothetical protein